jgi:ubiquinone/menaquinone biosynthesis C-methylase UbiE
MMTMQFLSHSQAARFYDLLGAGLDTQAVYEAAALDDLSAHLELESSRSLLEFGCGTGRFAGDLLVLAPQATYLGVDVSATMVGLASRRLRGFGDRAQVRRSDGAPHIDAPDGAFDRCISTYVLDLLSNDEIIAVLKEAHRVLNPDGLLGLVSLTNGPTAISRVVSTAWRGVHHLSPWVVGGCRPIALRAFMSNCEWRIDYSNIVVRFGVPSEIVVARLINRG